MTTPQSQDDELQTMDLLERVARWGYAQSSIVDMEAFLKLVNDGALDHQQAAHDVMQLIKARDEQLELRILQEVNTFRKGESASNDTVAWHVAERLSKLKSALTNPQVPGGE